MQGKQNKTEPCHKFKFDIIMHAELKHAFNRVLTIEIADVTVVTAVINS